MNGTADARHEGRVNGGRLGIVDLHTHPTLMSYMFGTKFWKTHHPPTWWCPWSMRVDLAALAAGGVNAFLCSTYVIERELFRDAWPLGIVTAAYSRAKHIATAPMDELTREYLDFAEEMAEATRRQHGDVVEIARTFGDMQRIMGEGKMCMLHAIEGAHHLNGNIEMVDELAARGVCHMIIPHLYPNPAGGCVNVFSKYRIGAAFGCFNPKYQDASGLTPWGHELVEKLLDVGILADPTHGTRPFRKQVFDIVRAYPKKRPLIMSHVCISGDGPTEFGPEPDEIKAIADTGGVVGIMMFTHREGKRTKMSGVDYAMNAIAHLVRHGGEDVVAIGSDFDGTSDVAHDMRSPRDYQRLREAILRKYSEDQAGKFMSRNAERTLQYGWGNGAAAVAEHEKNTR